MSQSVSTSLPLLTEAKDGISEQEAADLLCVSRPYLVSLVENGDLPTRQAGNQRRLLLKDVLASRQANQAERFAALDELSALHQEMGLE